MRSDERREGRANLGQRIVRHALAATLRPDQPIGMSRELASSVLTPYLGTAVKLPSRGLVMYGLSIGGAARAAGVGVETVRFYERRGLIAQPPKPLDSGFRRYPPESVERIRFIRRAQGLGFSLREIGELLALRADPSTDCAEVREHAIAKLEDIDRKAEELERFRRALETLIAACPGSGALRACSIMEALSGHATVARPRRRRTRARASRASAVKVSSSEHGADPHPSAWSGRQKCS